MQSPKDYGWVADEVPEFDDFCPEYGTAYTHWTDSTQEEVDKRNPIGFIWPT